MNSPRRDVVVKMTELWRLVRDGSYHVKRGPIHWPSFDFDQHPRGMALLVSESTLGQDINTATFEFQVAVRMQTAEAIDLDDGIQDEIYDDAEWVLREATIAINSQSDEIIMGLGWADIRVIEFQDVERLVQGVAITIPDIRY